MKKIDKFMIIPLVFILWLVTSISILTKIQHDPSSKLNSFYVTVYGTLLSIPFSLFTTFFQTRKSSERDLLNEVSSRIGQSFTLLNDIKINLKSIKKITNYKNSDNKLSKVQIEKIRDCLSQNINDIKIIYSNYYYLLSIIDFNQSYLTKFYYDKTYCTSIKHILNHLYKIYYKIYYSEADFKINPNT